MEHKCELPKIRWWYRDGKVVACRCGKTYALRITGLPTVYGGTVKQWVRLYGAS